MVAPLGVPASAVKMTSDRHWTLAFEKPMTAPQASVRPFPFTGLESLTRADVAQAARLRRVAGALVDVGRIEHALAELDGRSGDSLASAAHGECSRSVRPTTRSASCSRSPASPRARIRVAFSSRSKARSAAALSTRALRQKSPRIVDTSRTPSPALAGAFAAVLVAALRRAHAGGRLEGRSPPGRARCSRAICCPPSATSRPRRSPSSSARTRSRRA